MAVRKARINNPGPTSYLRQGVLQLLGDKVFTITEPAACQCRVYGSPPGRSHRCPLKLLKAQLSKRLEP